MLKNDALEGINKFVGRTKNYGGDLNQINAKK